MAITKKEKAEFDAAILAAKTLAALRWTEPVKKDLPIPSSGTVSGWDFNSYSCIIVQQWSEPESHGDGEKRSNQWGISYQNGKPLYSTKLLALKALRHEVENKVAKQLLSIDIQIEQENNNVQDR